MGDIIRGSPGIPTPRVSFATFAQNDDLRRWLRKALALIRADKF
ncbi:MAG: hypothetical protein JWM04_1401 [Verrucomicrobiales bacterium]|nr:hypothetical protein [Verrucomicrobiales bacterium]